MTTQDFYSSGEYTKKNHGYHIEDSKFKWDNFKKIILNSNIDTNKFNSIGEVGCGAGQILSEAKKSGMFTKANFYGYDPNPEAIKLAKKFDDTIDFVHGDFIKMDIEKSFDLIIVADVLEHLDDPSEFLEKLKKKSKFFLFNIPLEINFLSLIRLKNIFKESFKQVGHIHFYSNRTAQLTLERNGYKILNTIYANNRFFEIKKKFSLKKSLIYVPQYFCSLINKELACNIFGGYSLVVIAESI